MITTLAIKNYALIDDIRVDFNNGLTIITGETGAGKSILLGALSLVLGKRADVSSVKDTSKKCIIEAEFNLDHYDLEPVFMASDIDYEPHTILRREILPNGKSRAFVNDTPVTQSQLQTLGPHLVDIHSQHETLALSSETFQLEVIDVLGNNAQLISDYSHQLIRYREEIDQLNALKDSKDSAARELDYNTFLYNELNEVGLEKWDQQELEETYKTLTNTEEIQESLSKIGQLVAAEQIGSLETLKESRNTLNKLRSFSSEFEFLWSRLNSLIIELEDIHVSLEDQAATIEADPRRLQEVNDALQSIYKLQHKHKLDSIEELIKFKKELESKIEHTLSIDDQIEQLENKAAKSKEILLQKANEISQNRKNAIPNLKDQLETILQELGLPNARFQFNLEHSDTFRKAGVDVLELEFTANKGLPFGPLRKVASGGELSRIMLAVKAVLTRYKKLPTIIFDEIDSGVSGEIAHKMALIMASMSRAMQLLSITHLPQIAAKGEHHLKVYKEDFKDITVTRLKVLNDDERIVEIAQMIGGKSITDSAIAHAKELLN